MVFERLEAVVGLDESSFVLFVRACRHGEFYRLPPTIKRSTLKPRSGGFWIQFCLLHQSYEKLHVINAKRVIVRKGRCSHAVHVDDVTDDDAFFDVKQGAN